MRRQSNLRTGENGLKCVSIYRWLLRERKQPQVIRLFFSAAKQHQQINKQVDKVHVQGQCTTHLCHS